MVSCTICSSYETVVRLHPNAQLRHVKFEVVHAKTIQKKMQILRLFYHHILQQHVQPVHYRLKNHAEKMQILHTLPNAGEAGA